MVGISFFLFFLPSLGGGGTRVYFKRPMEMDIRELLSVCVSLSGAACSVIRSVQRHRENSGVLNAELKDPRDSRSYLTNADVGAQRVILSGLRREWPNLKIVAEEEEDTHEENKIYENNDTAELSVSKSLCRDLKISDALKNLPMNDVCLFIDPLDGTREFVEGRLESVQSLIGISVRGQSVAGVMGLPFHHEQCSRNLHTIQAQPPSAASGVVVYGLVGAGVFGIKNVKTAGRAGNMLLATSAKCKEPALKIAQRIIIQPTCTKTGRASDSNADLDSNALLKVGGCGHKVLRLLTGEADVALFNLVSSVWDTCATEALLHASGGRMTNLFGWPLNHSYDDCVIHTSGTSALENPGQVNPLGSPLVHHLGVLATTARFEDCDPLHRSHAQLCKILSQHPEVLALLRPCGLIPPSTQVFVLLNCPPSNWLFVLLFILSFILTCLFPLMVFITWGTGVTSITRQTYHGQSMDLPCFAM